MNKIEGVSGTYLSNAALEPHRIVKVTAAASGLNPATVGYADADDVTIVDKVLGVTTTRTSASGQLVTVEYMHSPGTRVFSAADAIASGAFAFAAANGQVSNAGTVKRGLALDASAAAGEYIACQPYLNT